ncbi:MAG TPA: MauE/DoxX family redox-associated membrane protein [Methylotenera sp.]|nr:MauE/DoxX family redox-associated membrane protein [Methylotenera sp.]
MNTNKIYTVSGMTCNNCVARVQSTLASYAEAVEVTLNPPQIKLTNQKLDNSALNDILQSAGNYKIGTEVSAPSNADISADIPNKSLATYKPLILVFAYILGVCLLVESSHGDFNLHRFMPNFMAGFFLVFSFFKLLDLAGFANSYAMYDVLAKRVPVYGYIYPFIELALGVAYLLTYRPMLINGVTLIVMAFSSIGVISAVLSKQKIKCACLGTGFNLPMTTVTIIEDVLMAAMAAWMLI